MSLVRRFLRILTLRCEEASALASQAMDEPLGALERVALRGHLLVCAPCRRFRAQLAVLRRSQLPAGAAVTPSTDAAAERLSDEAKSRMAAAIATALGDRGDASQLPLP